MSEHRRWNIEETPEGFQICKGEHDKSQPCEWIELVTKATMGEALQQQQWDMEEAESRYDT